MAKRFDFEYITQKDLLNIIDQKETVLIFKSHIEK